MERKLSLISSMQNNVQKKYPWAALMLSNYHTKLANDAKYDGVEWYSFRSSSFQLRYFPSTIDLKRIKSTHQSWGSGKFPQNIGMVGKLESLKDQVRIRSEDHTSELQSPNHLLCRLLL